MSIHTLNKRRASSRVSRSLSNVSSTKKYVWNECGRKRSRNSKSFNVRFQEQVDVSEKCLECRLVILDFSKHYSWFSPSRCSICSYTTCCTQAYTDHISRHSPDRLAVKSSARRNLHSDVMLICFGCHYSSAYGNLMAEHLLMFPAHLSCKTLTEHQDAQLTSSRFELDRLRAELREAHARTKHLEEENLGLKRYVEELKRIQISSHGIQASGCPEEHLHSEQQHLYEHLTRPDLLHLLVSRETELKEIQKNSSDLKQYIDTLLVSIMEHAPFLLRK